MHRYNTHDGSSAFRVGKVEQPQSLFKELSLQGTERKDQKSRIPKMSQINERSNQKSQIFQKKPKSLSLEMPHRSQLKELWSDGVVNTSKQKGPQLVSTVCPEKQHDYDSTDNLASSNIGRGLNLEDDYPIMSDDSEHAEQSLFAELCNSLSEEQSKSSQGGALKPNHRRNASDCSLSSLTEGSRKRQHDNIRAESDESDEDIPERSGCKQTLYSQDRDKVNRLSHNSSFDSDACNSGILPKARWDKNACLTTWNSSDNISDQGEDDTLELTTYHLYSTAFDDTEPMSMQLMQEINMGSSCEDDTKELASGPCMRDLSQFTELSPVSELPPPSQENPTEQSLFSELSTQMSEEKPCSGSDSSPGCAMGVFDFSASHSSQDGDTPGHATDMPDQGQRLDSEMVIYPGKVCWTISFLVDSTYLSCSILHNVFG